jgi:hypothetical protein
MTCPYDTYNQDEPVESRWAAHHEQTFEQRSVEWVLKGLGRTADRPLLRQDCVRRTGLDQLTFVDFQERYPEFPLVLRTRYLDKLHVDPAMLLAALLKQFARSPLCRAYEAAREDYRAVKGRRQGPFGLVVPRKGISGGLVIHNAPQLMLEDVKGTVILHRGGPRRGDCRVVQPLRDLVAAIALRQGAAGDATG